MGGPCGGGSGAARGPDSVPLAGAPACSRDVGVSRPSACSKLPCEALCLIGHSMTKRSMPLHGALELNWYTLNPFDFFLWPEALLGFRSTGIVRGKALIREKEFTKHSPFPKNQIVSVIAKLPASLKHGLQKAQHNNCCFVKFYGYRQWKGQGPLRARFFAQGVSPTREREILQDCGIPQNQWP